MSERIFNLVRSVVNNIEGNFLSKTVRLEDESRACGLAMDSAEALHRWIDCQTPGQILDGVYTVFNKWGNQSGLPEVGIDFSPRGIEEYVGTARISSISFQDYPSQETTEGRRWLTIQESVSSGAYWQTRYSFRGDGIIKTIVLFGERKFLTVEKDSTIEEKDLSLINKILQVIYGKVGSRLSELKERRQPSDPAVGSR